MSGFAAGVTVLAVLLTVELFAAQAAVAEGALIYVARNANLMWSVIGLAVQAGLSLLLVPMAGPLGGGVGAVVGGGGDSHTASVKQFKL